MLRLAPFALAFAFSAARAIAQEPAAHEAGSALADPSVPSASPTTPSASGFALDIDAMAILPLVVGGTFALEVPGHFVFRAGGGVVPSALVDAINSVGVGWGAYDTTTAHLASLLLNDAMIFEVGVGIRPAGTPGVELALSYLLLWTQRGIDMSQLGGAPQGAGLDVLVDAIHGELAWQSTPIEHVYFRIAIGWAQAFDHHVTLAAHADAATSDALHHAADDLTATVGRYAFGPTLGAALGLRL